MKWCISFRIKFWIIVLLILWIILIKLPRVDNRIDNRLNLNDNIEWRYCIFDFETSTIFHDFTFNMSVNSVYSLSNLVNMVFTFEQLCEASMFLIWWAYSTGSFLKVIILLTKLCLMNEDIIRFADAKIASALTMGGNLIQWKSSLNIAWSDCPCQDIWR